MRALLLLVLVVLAFLLVRWFFPASTAGDAPSATEAPHFLAPPIEASLGVSEPPASPTPAAQQAPRVSVRGGSEDELALGAALLHGTPPDVQSAAAGISPGRALLAEAFAWALAGEKQLAHSLAAKIDKDEVGGRESALLEAALTGKSAVPAAAGETGPLLLAMEMGLAAREAKTSLASGDHALAARRYSELLVQELEAPWAADPRTLAQWSAGLAEAQRRNRWSPRGDWPAVELEVREGDTLSSIRKRYLTEHPGALMCTGLIERANGLKGFLQPGQVLRIPTEPASILVDLPARWALFYLGEEVVCAWQVGIGRPGEETPPGDYVVKDKIENPPWMKTGQEMIPFGDPRNPLGTRWIGWYQDGRKTSYGFHGTGDPTSIGQACSDGCVRFLNRDVEELSQILPEGAPIRIRG